MEAAIKAGEGKQAAAFERAQLMRHLNYSVEDLEKAYAATGHNSAAIQSILLGIYCDNGVADKASKTFFQLALSGKLTSDTALAQFDRVYPLILAESTDNAVLAKKAGDDCPYLYREVSCVGSAKSKAGCNEQSLAHVHQQRTGSDQRIDR